jgi:Rad3-related DNA helicase
LNDEQEVLMHVADMLMDVFAADSSVLRATAAARAQAPRAALQVDAARVLVNDVAMRLEASARQALAAMIDGDTLTMTLSALKRLLKLTPINTAALRRGIADETVAHRGYIF